MKRLLHSARSATDFVEQRRALGSRGQGARRSVGAAQLADDAGRRDYAPAAANVLSDVAEQHPRLAWDFLVANRAAVEALLDPLPRLEYPTTIADNSSDPAVADALVQYASN